MNMKSSCFVTIQCCTAVCSND